MTKSTKFQTIKAVVVPLATAIIGALGMLLASWLSHANPTTMSSENQFYERLGTLAIEETLGNSMILVGVENVRGVERIIRNPSDLSFRVYIQDANLRWEEQRSVAASDRGYLILKNLKSGIYRTELKFFEATVAREDNIVITPNRGQYVRLVALGTPGQLRFHVADTQNKPAPNLYVVLSTNLAIPVRESVTDVHGNSLDFWANSLGVDSTDYYFAQVYASSEKKELLASSKPVRPLFNRTGQLIETSVIVKTAR